MNNHNDLESDTYLSVSNSSPYNATEVVETESSNANDDRILNLKNNYERYELNSFSLCSDDRLKRGTIHSIELHNFKSYFGTVVIDNLSSFNAIIGPNGAGKSNLMDAISFVLCIRTSTLRGMNLKDLINKNPDPSDPLEARYAYVSLTLKGDTEFSVFKRAISAKGHITYVYNNNVITFKGYTEALHEYKINTLGSTGLIFQGSVNDIISRSPSELTKLFENISGSSLYEKPYNFIKEKLEIVRSDYKNMLSKKKQLTNELKQFRSMASNNKKYQQNLEEHNQTQLNVYAWQFAILAHKYRDSKARYETLVNDYQELVEKFELSNRSKNKLEEKITNLYYNQGKVNRLIQQKTQLLNNTRNSMTEYFGKKASLENQIANLEKVRLSMEDDLENLRRQHVEINDLRDKLNEEIENVSKQLESLKGDTVTLSSSQIEEFNRYLKEFRKSTSSIKVNMNLIKTSINQYKSENKTVTNKLNGLEAQMTQVEDNISKHSQLIESMESKLRDYRDSVETLHLTLNKLEVNRSELVEQNVDLTSKKVMYDEKINTLSVLKQEYSHMFKRTLSNNEMSKAVAGVYGEVLSLFQITNSSYSKAIMTAFGSRAHTIVTKDYSTISKCIQYLKEHKSDRRDFLSMESLGLMYLDREDNNNNMDTDKEKENTRRGEREEENTRNKENTKEKQNKRNEEKERNKEKEKQKENQNKEYDNRVDREKVDKSGKRRSIGHFLRRVPKVNYVFVIDSIEYDEKYSPLFEYLVGDTVIVPSLDDAEKIVTMKSTHRSETNHLSFNVVTHNGQLITRNKTIIIGSMVASKNNEVELEIAQFNKYVSLLNETEKELQTNTNRQKLVSDEIQNNLTKMEKYKRNIELTNMKLEFLRRQRDSLKMQKQDLLNEVGKLRKQTKSLEKSMDSLNNELKRENNKLDKMKEEHFSPLNERFGVEDVYQVMSTRDERTESLNNELVEKRNTLSRYSRDSEELEVKLELVKNKREELELGLKKRREELGSLKDTNTDTCGELETIQNEITKYKAKLEEYMKEIDECNKEMKKLQEQEQQDGLYGPDGRFNVMEEITKLKEEMKKLYTEAVGVSETCKVKNIPLEIIIKDNNKNKEENNNMDIDEEEERRKEEENTRKNTRNEEKQTVKERNEEVEREFPELVNYDEFGFSKSLQVLEGQYESKQERLRSLKKALASTRSYNNVEGKVESTSTELDIVDREVEKLKAQLVKLESDFEKIKKERSGLFLHCFHTVKENIGPIYRKLSSLDGEAEGQAFLSLDDVISSIDVEPFNCNIRYNTMPPMKKYLDLNLQSGGEKALSSIALLLALHNYRESPFVVLDEIDANIDAIKLKNLTKFLMESKFQVIIISLKDKLFSKAQRLIGVYRNHPNCASKCVVLNLEEYENEDEDEEIN